jgi:hypothetical protein
MAGGLQQAGQWRAALDHYVKLVDLDEAKRPMDPVDRSYAVRRDRWVQVRLNSLRHDGGAEAAAEIDRLLAVRLRSAMETKGVDALRRFLDYFGNQPAAAEARRELIRRLTGGGRFLEVELLLSAEAASGDAVAQGAAMAQMADMYARAGRKDAALACYRQLESRFADVVCRDGKTGGQLAAALPGDSPVREGMLHPRPAWPVGEVEVKRGPGNLNASPYGRFNVGLPSDSGPFFTDATVRFDSNRQSILGYDEYGRQAWDVPLSEHGRRAGYMYNANMVQARVLGHLVVVSMGTKILGLDPAGVSGNTAKLIWTQDMNDAVADQFGNSPFMFQGRGFAMINGAFVQSSPNGRMNPLGPVTPRYVSFLRLRNLVVADPATGESLWVRQDIPANAEVFGDDDYIFILPGDRDEATVYNAADGERLGVRKIKRPTSHDMPFDGIDRSVYNAFSLAGLAFVGRNMLSWEQIDPQGGRALKFFDVWQQRELWPTKKYPANTRAYLLGDEAVGVCEPDGHFTLLCLADGRPIIDTKLQPEKSLAELFVTRMGDQYLVMTQDNRIRKRTNRYMSQPLPGTLFQQVRLGHLYAFDLGGKSLWPHPVEIEDQALVLGQPTRLPVLVFASLKYDQRNNRPNVRTNILAIDRRNGRVVYEKETSYQSMTLDLIGNPEQKSVEILTQGGTVALSFTDKPLPPETARKREGRITDALWDALEKSAGGADEDPSAVPAKQ